jgi:hypothetical protein
MSDQCTRIHAARRAALAFACAIMTMLILAARAGSPAGAAPTPVPGGANQIKGITGSIHQTLFNGKLRLRGMQLREAVPADNVSGSPGDNVMLFTYIFSDGIAKHIYGNTSMTAADASGVTQNCKSVGVYGAYYSMEAGESARLKIYCDFPSDFTPVKFLLIPGDGPAFRLNLKPSDVPKPPAPAGSPTPAS